MVAKNPKAVQRHVAKNHIEVLRIKRQGKNVPESKTIVHLFSKKLRTDLQAASEQST